MTSNAGINKIPIRLINECCFCHKKGLKPGILEVEFSRDIKTQEHFSKIANELPINESGMCDECEELVSNKK